MTRKEEILAKAKARQAQFQSNCKTIKENIANTTKDQKWMNDVANNMQSAFISRLKETFKV